MSTTTMRLDAETMTPGDLCLFIAKRSLDLLEDITKPKTK